MRSLSVACLTASTLLLAGCVTTPRAQPGPLVSPTGIVYAPGTLPVETRESQTAAQYLRQGLLDRAVELALEGVAADPGNPIHHFLAGVAHARLGSYERADERFAEAERIYPAYELEIEPEREAAWGEAFNAGLAAYEDGDIDRTIELWRGAVSMYDLRPEAHRNLATLLAAEGRFTEAADVYTEALAGLGRRPATRLLREEDLLAREEHRVQIENGLSELLLMTARFAEAEPLLRRRLAREPDDVELRASLAAALSGLGRVEEADEIYATLLSDDRLQLTELFALGIGLFRSAQYDQAAGAFERVTELQPDSRDAWFDLANSLFAGEAWEALAAVGGRLIQLDPLGENARLMHARALLELGDRPGAVAGLALLDQSPVLLEGLQLQRSSAHVVILGRVTGAAAPEGTPIRLRFYFYGEDAGLLGAEEIGFPAPSRGETANLEVSFALEALAYRYELIL